VKDEYRRRGVALGLLVRGIGLAQEREHKTLVGHTDENNQAILAVTERLGFTHLPAQVLYVKRFEEAGRLSDEN
jgi:RimJ/RimL family protein N-acetyltransferase